MSAVQDDPLWCFLIDAIDAAMDVSENPYHTDGGGYYYIGEMASALAGSLRKAGWVTERTEMRDENTRLRGALEEVVGQSAAWATKIARDALAAGQ